MMICCSAAEAINGAGSSRNTAATMCAAVCPGNARVPVTISYRTAPKLKISDLASSGLPSACSGDMYNRCAGDSSFGGQRDIRVGRNHFGEPEINEFDC